MTYCSDRYRSGREVEKRMSTYQTCPRLKRVIVYQPRFHVRPGANEKGSRFFPFGLKLQGLRRVHMPSLLGRGRSSPSPPP